MLKVPGNITTSKPMHKISVLHERKRNTLHERVGAAPCHTAIQNQMSRTLAVLICTEN